MNSQRVLMVMLDGASFDALSTLADQGKLPNLRALKEDGSFNVLKSTLPASSPVAIPSLVTGMTPGGHGRFGWGYLKDGLIKPYPPLHNLSTPTIWEIVNAYHKKVVLLNLPLTYPPFEVNGILISGPPTSMNRAYAYPPEILPELRTAIGEYFVDIPLLGNDFAGEDEEVFIRNAYRVTRARFQAMQYLLTHYHDWSLFLSVFTTIDRFQHVFFGYFDEESPLYNPEKRQILVDYYIEIDRIIGQIRHFLDKQTTLCIVSDHGFNYIAKYVGLNNIFAKHGFVKTQSPYQIFTIDNLDAVFSRLGLGEIQQKIPLSILERLKPLFPRKTKFSQSKCFVFGGQIYINEAVFTDPTQIERAKQQITALLEAIRDPNTGEKVVAKVYDRTELYQGQQVSRRPHLIIRATKGYETRSWTKDTFHTITPIPKKTTKTGSHGSEYSRRGILIVSGPRIQKGSHITANITDVSPTILHILGLPVPRQMEGRTLQELFDPDVQIVPELTPQDIVYPSYRERLRQKIQRVKDRLNQNA